MCHLQDEANVSATNKQAMHNTEQQDTDKTIGLPLHVPNNFV